MSVTSFIDEHIPSLTDEDDLAMADIMDGTTAFDPIEYAEFAKRTCKCGVKIDGFYEYVDHLKAELRKAGFS